MLIYCIYRIETLWLVVPHLFLSEYRRGILFRVQGVCRVSQGYLGERGTYNGLLYDEGDDD